jgi:subtilisin family serine protease
MRRVRGAGAACALVAAASAAAFTPTDPLAGRQWYLEQNHTFDYWATIPDAGVETVKVAVIDSGIDGGHPDLAGKVVAAKSFVGGSPYHDVKGHGTFVAGLIAATADNGEGIAGMAFNAKLVVAKVVKADGSVPLRAEVAAIRWAADQGARVINLSLGGVRDPVDVRNDTYSPLEQAAVQYAFAKGAVVVAAVGNGPQSPSTPWPYAHYPSALPHVLGVGALSRDGSVPAFSNRDAVYVDIAAPGKAILSTLPRALTAEQPTCLEQGYSSCAPADFHTEGTSFAAPQVSAAAALVLGVRPDLGPEQVVALLERSTDDVNASTGCHNCASGRDRFTGWGRLDVLKALEQLDGATFATDRYETNDDAGPWAFRLFGRRQTFSASLDFWDDQVDVYAVRIRRGQRLFARVSTTAGVGAGAKLLLWKPRTETVEGLRVPLAMRAAQGARVGIQERLAYTAPETGWYYVEIKLATPGAGEYTLSYAKS